MSVTPSSTIVGVFRDHNAAEQALDALYNAGFTHEQVRYSGSENAGGFFDELKNFLTGQTASNNVASDLADWGLSDEEANYYANEHNRGNVILAVKAPGRGAETQTILQQYGALNVQPQTMTSSQDITYTDSTPVNDSTAQTTQYATSSPDTGTNYSSSSHNASFADETSTQATELTSSTYHDDTGQTAPVTITHDIDSSEQQLQPSVTTHSDTEQQAPAAASDTPPITHDNVNDAAYVEQGTSSEEAYLTDAGGDVSQHAMTTGSYNETASPASYSEPEQSPTHDALPSATTDPLTDTFTSPASIEDATASHATNNTTGDAFTDTQKIVDVQPVIIGNNTTDTQPMAVEDGTTDTHTISYGQPVTTQNDIIVTRTPEDTQPSTVGDAVGDTVSETDTQSSTTGSASDTYLPADTQASSPDATGDTYTDANTHSTLASDTVTDPHATSDIMIESETPSYTTEHKPQEAVQSYTEESEAAGMPDIQTAQPVATTSDYSSDSQSADVQEAMANAPTEPLSMSNSTSNETAMQAQQLPENDSNTLTVMQAQEPVTGTVGMSSDANDEIQGLQAQIAFLQQQLQEAKAQLQAVKDREEQVRAAREREQQLQSLREQLQALQAELASTHSEIQETQNRIGQY